MVMETIKGPLGGEITELCLKHTLYDWGKV
jgi:hypothetical protein